MFECCGFSVSMHILFVVLYTVLGLSGVYFLCNKAQCGVKGCCSVWKVTPWVLLLGVLSCALVLLWCCL